jgi:hypothetical protein
MEEIKEKAKQIGDKPSPSPFLPDAVKSAEIATKTQIDRTKKAAKALGMKDGAAELRRDQKIIRTAIVSFLIMVIVLFFDWITSYVVGNEFVGTWEDVLGFLKIVSVLFTQVVLAKIRQYYDQIAEEKV